MNAKPKRGVVVVGDVRRPFSSGKNGLSGLALSEVVEMYAPEGVGVLVAQHEIELARHIGVSRRKMELLGVVLDDEFSGDNGGRGFGVAMDFLTEDMEGEGPIAVASSERLSESDYLGRGEIQHVDREGKLWMFLRSIVIDDMINEFEIPLDANEVRFEMPSVHGLKCTIEESFLRKEHCLDENMRMLGFKFDSASIGDIPGKPHGLTMVYRPRDVESTVPSARIREQMNRGFANLLRLYPTLEIKVERGEKED